MPGEKVEIMSVSKKEFISILRGFPNIFRRLKGRAAERRKIFRQMKRDYILGWREARKTRIMTRESKIDTNERLDTNEKGLTTDRRLITSTDEDLGNLKTADKKDKDIFIEEGLKQLPKIGISGREEGSIIVREEEDEISEKETSIRNPEKGGEVAFQYSEEDNSMIQNELSSEKEGAQRIFSEEVMGLAERLELEFEYNSEEEFGIEDILQKEKHKSDETREIDEIQVIKFELKNRKT